MDRLAKAEVYSERGYKRSSDAAAAAGMSPLLFSRLASSVSVKLSKDTAVDLGKSFRCLGPV